MDIEEFEIISQINDPSIIEALYDDFQSREELFNQSNYSGENGRFLFQRDVRYLEEEGLIEKINEGYILSNQGKQIASELYDEDLDKEQGEVVTGMLTGGSYQE